MTNKLCALVGILFLFCGLALSTSANPVAPAASPGALAVGSATMGLTQPEDEPSDDGDADEESPLIRKLTPAEINRIRYIELKAMRLKEGGVDSVSVKIPREVVDEFLVEMEGHEAFDSKSERREFLKKTPPQKLETIAHFRGIAYADKVEIQSDPEVLVEFRTRIMPVVLRSCATSGCHATSNKNAAGFVLYKDPKKTPATTLANFIVLNELTVGGERMINRDMPDRSLLLNYLLPRKDVKPELRHPGEIEYRSVYNSPKNPRFRRLRDWIASLNHPAVDYQVRVLPLREPAATQPADEPAPPPPPPGGPQPGTRG